MIGRLLKAFRVAFWEALYKESSRHATHGVTMKVNVDSDEALQAIAVLDAKLTALAERALTAEKLTSAFRQTSRLAN